VLALEPRLTPDQAPRREFVFRRSLRSLAVWLPYKSGCPDAGTPGSTVCGLFRRGQQLPNITHPCGYTGMCPYVVIAHELVGSSKPLDVLVYCI
jgi:hypothetical protein